MGFGDSSLFLKITLVLLAVGLLVQILAVALPYWYAKDYGAVDAYGGLWKACTKISSTTNCAEYKDSILTDWFKAVRAFELLGLLVLVAALAVTVVVLFVSDSKIIKLVGWICSFVACGFIFIGVFIYAGEADPPLDEYSGAFAIAIIAALIALAAGVLGLLDWMGMGK